MKRTILVVLAVSLCYVASAQIIPFDPAVCTGKLANGFTYYIRHNEEPKNRVFFYLANKVGSVLETDDQRGLTHFMEHMLFNGTAYFSKNELINYLQNHLSALSRAEGKEQNTISYQSPVEGKRERISSGHSEVIDHLVPE